MKNYKFTKLTGCDCKRCKSQMNLLEKFIMPDEFTYWLCNNCGTEWKVYGSVSEHDGVQVEMFETDRRGNTKKHIFVFNDTTNTFTKVM